VLKEVIGQCADGTLPACRLIETLFGETAVSDESTSWPISTLGYATALS
jgi:hypothetical protein